MGAVNQAQAQAVLDAQREANRLEAYEPYERLGYQQSGVASIASGAPGQYQSMVTPNPTPLQNALGIAGVAGGLMTGYGDYLPSKDFMDLYAVGDEGNASLQIIDLTALPNALSLATEIQDERVGKAHNIYIDSIRKLMYLCLVTPIINGSESSLIPLRVFSLEDPLSPQLLFVQLLQLLLSRLASWLS